MDPNDWEVTITCVFARALVYMCVLCSGKWSSTGSSECRQYPRRIGNKCIWGELCVRVRACACARVHVYYVLL